MKPLNLLAVLKRVKDFKVYRYASCLFLLLPSLVFAQSFFETHSDGWFWYQDAPFDTKIPPNSPKNSSDNLLNPTEAMLQLRQKVEDSLNLAILSPTSENLQNYAAQYFEVIRRGQRFTDAYKVMALNHPQYDYSLKFPTNHLVQHLHIAEQLKITDIVKIFITAKCTNFLCVNSLFKNACL